MQPYAAQVGFRRSVGFAAGARKVSQITAGGCCGDWGLHTGDRVYKTERLLQA